MPNILIRDVSRKTVDRLKEKARQHNRSLQGEVKRIIEESAQMTMQDAAERARKIRESFRGRTFSDSAEMIREDRNR